MAEDIKNNQNTAEQEGNESSFFDLQTVIRALVLNWQWSEYWWKRIHQRIYW